MRLLLGGLAASLLLAAPALATEAKGPEESAPPPKPPVTAPGGPLSLSGGIYLFDYEPIGEGAKSKFEIYAFLLNVDARTDDGKYGLHTQLRLRDSKLRSFFLSNAWFQEAYVYAKASFGEVHAGKFYRKVGILWDDSFFGDVQYFNGLKLNPDYGLELVGPGSASSGLSFPWSLQFFQSNDHVNGSLPGRDVESDPGARLHATCTGRVAPTWKLGESGSFALGLSGFSGRIDREEGRDFRIQQGAADASLSLGRAVSYVEVLRQKGERFDAAHPASRPGYDTATYLLAGTRWQLASWVNARVNYSQATYEGQETREWELVPGLLITPVKHVAVYVEYDLWKLDPDQGPTSVIDKSMNVVLNYNF